MNGTIPELAVLGSKRKQAVQATRNKTVTSTSPMASISAPTSRFLSCLGPVMTSFIDEQ